MVLHQRPGFVKFRGTLTFEGEESSWLRPEGEHMTSVTASLKTGTAVDIRARRFLWRSDEPKLAGGKDSGPTPYEFLLGSLAACTAMTLRFHATKTGIPLAGIDVTLEYDPEHAQDSNNLEAQDDDLIAGIKNRIMIHGQLTEQQRILLRRIATQSPVHKTLINKIPIDDAVSFTTTD